MSSIVFGDIQPKRRGKTFTERLSKVIQKGSDINKDLTSKNRIMADLQVALQVTLQVLNVGVGTWPERTSLKHLGHPEGEVMSMWRDGCVS